MTQRTSALFASALALVTAPALADPIYTYVDDVADNNTGMERCLIGSSGTNVYTETTTDNCGDVGPFADQNSIIKLITDDLAIENPNVTLTRVPDDGSDSVFTAFDGTVVTARALDAGAQNVSFGVIPGRSGGTYQEVLPYSSFTQNTPGGHLLLTNSYEFTPAVIAADGITTGNLSDIALGDCCTYDPIGISSGQYRAAISNGTVTLSSDPNDASADNGGLDHMVSFIITGLDDQSANTFDYIFAFTDGGQADPNVPSLGDQDYNDFVVEVQDTIDWVPTSVPEPSSMAMFSVGFVGLVGLRRRFPSEPAAAPRIEAKISSRRASRRHRIRLLAVDASQGA